MSKFIKLASILLLILLIEAIIIYRGYKVKISTDYPCTIPSYSPKSSIIIVVDASSNTLSVFQHNEIIKTYNVATGKQNTPSPIGTWKIINKDTWGSGFGGHWMGLNVPWGKYGIHGTIFPNSIGWNSSHGCIRMKNKDIAQLYKITPYGTPVIIWGGPYGNFGNYLRTIKPGDRGADVYEVQKILRQKGYYNGNPDGIYGNGMRYVIHKYQKDNGLYISDTITLKFYKSIGIYLID